jgi:wobble nucleotide-excising tRNase
LTGLDYVNIIKKFQHEMMGIKVKILIPTVALIITLAGTSGIYAEKLYTWTDQKGIIHITDTPPPQNASVKEVTPYSEKTPQEVDAIERQKQQLREMNQRYDKAEAAQQAELEAQEADKRAKAAVEKAQEEYQRNQEYVRRLSSTKQKRRQFRKKIERIKRETEADRAAAEAALQQAEEAAKKAQTADAQDRDQ